MEITERSVGKVTVLELSGQINGTTDKEYFYSAVVNASSPIVLNLAGASSIDQEGVGMLIAACNHVVREKKGWIAIVELNPSVNQLALVLARMFKYFDTERAAVEELQRVG